MTRPRGRPSTRRGELLGRAWRNRSLRRLALATAGFRAAELAVWIALAAFVYARGGVGETAAVMIAELAPAAAFALVVGALIRRRGAAAVLRWGLAAQGVALAVAAVFLQRGDTAWGVVAAVVAATAVTTTRPAESVVTPTLVDGPEDLTAANVLTGVLLSIAGLLGPAAAAVIMTAVGTWAVFASMAVVMLGATAAVWRLSGAVRAGDEDAAESVLDGLRATAAAPGPRVMVIAIAVYYVVIGALDVLAVVIAVELLGKEEAYAGYVTTVLGVGSLIAGGLAIALIGRRWIAPWILVSAFATGAALIAVSIAGARVGVSLLVLGALGIGEGIYELTARMLLQRVSRLDIVGHVFALVESLQMAMLAVGAAAVPLAAWAFGSKHAPAAIGVVFALAVAALAARIVVIDRHARVPITEMAILRSTALFAALPAPALETVAREARRLVVPAGTVVVRQGDPGHEYFAVVSGALVAAIDGRDRTELGRGDGFGEVALVRSVPRTATVRATADSVLLAVDRGPFLVALTGHLTTRDRAAAIARAHLERPPPRMPGGVE